jgi:hypothetical protein
LAAAVGALGDGPLDESGLQRHVAPLFSRVLAQWRDRVYLANHSLGRPLDATETRLCAKDLRRGTAHMGRSVGAWLDEMRALPDNAVAPSSWARRASTCSRSQGERRPGPSRDPQTPTTPCHAVVADARRVSIRSTDPARVRATRPHRADVSWTRTDVLGALDAPVDLVVVSHVMFNTGARVPNLDAIVARIHRGGGLVMLDIYHSLGVIPRRRARLTSTSPWAARTSTCAAARARATCTSRRAPRRPASHARHRLVRQARSVRVPASDPPCSRRAATPFSSRRRRCFRSIRRAPAVLMLGVWASIACVRYSLACSKTLVALLAERGVAAQGGTRRSRRIRRR